MTGPRAFLVKGAFSVGLLVGFLLLLELVFRVTHLFGAHVAWSEPHALYGWRFTPNRTFLIASENDHPIRGRINNLGWRDSDRTVEKPDGTRRIAVIGDSFVESFQVEMDSTFLALAEKDLNVRHDFPVEVLGFGRSGATTGEEMLFLLHEALPLDPDVLALVFVPTNDVRDVSVKTSPPLRPFYVPQPDGSLALDLGFTEGPVYHRLRQTNAVKQRSALLNLVAQKYRLWQEANIEARKEAVALPGHLTLCTQAPDPLFAENYELNKTLIRAMADTCSARGIPFVLVCNFIEYLPEKVAEMEARTPGIDLDFFERDLAAFADSIGVAYLGLQEPFRQVNAETGERLHWGHWNYAGHRLVAKLLAEKLDTYLGSP